VDRDAESFDLPGQVVDQMDELVPVRAAGGEQSLPAEDGRPLVQGHAVASPGRDLRGLEARRSPADDGDTLAEGSGPDLGLAPPRLLSHRRIVDAGDWFVREEPAHALLVAGDADPDLLEPALGRLDREIRIADQGAGHGDEIRLPPGDDLVRQDRVVDSPVADDRGRPPRCPYRRPEGESLLDRHAARLVHARAFERKPLVGPVADLDERYALFGHSRGDLLPLVQGQPAGHQLPRRQLDPDDEPFAAPRADRIDDLHQKPHPVLEAPPVPVSPVIAEGREELLDEIAGRRVQLHPVEAPGLGQPRRMGEGGDDLMNLLAIHLLRHLPDQGAGQRRWGP